MTIVDNTEVFLDALLEGNIMQLESLIKKGNIDYSKYLGEISHSFEHYPAVGNGITCLEFAVTKPDILMVLLEYANLDLDQRNMNGAAPIHIACHNGMASSVDQLIYFGADIDAQDDNGKTALHVAADDGHADLIVILLEYSASPNIKDRNGETALHKAVRKGRPNIAEVLIENGADINAADNSGRTPLHVAALYNLGYMMLCLTEIGADPKTLDYEGNQPYQLAKNVYLNTTLAIACDFDKQKWDHFNS